MTALSLRRFSSVLYKRSAIAHGAGGNKRGLAVLDYVIAEQGAAHRAARSTDLLPPISQHVPAWA